MLLERLNFCSLWALAGCLLAVWPMLAMASPEVTQQARQFLEQHETKYKPLEIEANLAWWEANTTGGEEAYAKKEKAQNRLDEALANKEAFAKLKALREKKQQIDEPILARAIEVLYLLYLEKQVEPALLKRMVTLSNAVEKDFNKFRARVENKEMTENEVRKVLKQSKDSERRKVVWEASKAVGAELLPNLKELVKLRNEAAKQLGFKNYHEMMLNLNEQTGEAVVKLFDELDELTREPFRAAKAEMDAKLALDCKVKQSELMPWHYHDPFFQETPTVFSADLDQPFVKADLLKLSKEFYAGINLPIEAVIEKSDLYEKKGKSPHAFCTDITRDGKNTRVLANIENNAYWATTLLHEFGHAVYSSINIPEQLPYTLRTDAHMLTTEGVAMMFQRMTNRGAFLEKMGLKVEDKAAYDVSGARSLQYGLLIFSRWCQVMLRFEKSMYENPEQDLGKLWWDLVEKYQLVKRPAGRTAPDFASKIHIVSAPVYYHNYMMGELFASQVHHAIARDVYKGADPNEVTYVGNPEVGKFMRERVFGPGRSLNWNDLTKHATGEFLQAKAFAADFKKK